MDKFKTPGAISWHELTTTDVEGAKALCSLLYGWTLESMDTMGYAR